MFFCFFYVWALQVVQEIYFFLLSGLAVDMYFSQELYEAKENERLEVRLEKSKRIARPVSLRVTPMSVDDIVPAHLLNATSQSVCPYSCSCDCSINIVSGMFYINE